MLRVGLTGDYAPYSCVVPTGKSRSRCDDGAGAGQKAWCYAGDRADYVEVHDRRLQSGPLRYRHGRCERHAVNPGGTNEAFAKAHFPHAKLEALPDNRTIFDDLAEGHGDVMVTDGAEVDYQARPPS